MSATLADDLIGVVERATEPLQRLSEADVSSKPGPGQWSKKEILGHLIDSAANNHHRFVRAQQVDHLAFPDYQQDEWVRIQRYNDRSWTEIVELWRAYNHHLAHVIRQIPSDKLGVTCEVGPAEPPTLQGLVEDYLPHLIHHLRQLGVT